jgi:hypothetical protein
VSVGILSIQDVVEPLAIPPGRVTGSWDYAVNGIEVWHTGKKLGGRYGAAPILIDRLQGLGNWSPRNNSGSLQWTTTDGESGRRVPSATRRGQGGAPTGGNFLFEDGHVEWRRFDVGNSRGTTDMTTKLPAQVRGWGGWLLALLLAGAVGGSGRNPPATWMDPSPGNWVRWNRVSRFGRPFCS